MKKYHLPMINYTIYEQLIITVIYLFKFIGWLLPRILVVVLGLMLYGASHAQGAYVAVGVGVHSEAADCPEVCYGDNMLARVRVGYEWDNVVIEAVHISNPAIFEGGYGLNAVFVDYKLRF